MAASRGPLRRVAAALVYVAYLAAFVAVVDYVFFWRPWVATLRGLRRTELASVEHVGDATMRRLGALRADRASSFPRYSPEKPPGTLRLCALGDSFTYGDEAADGHDYPALLERLFAERGAPNVEVVNFGNPWYGFHQTYFLWESVARGYDCDVVLLGPECFEPARDTTFNHTGMSHPYYLHARYVLAGRGVRAVEVIGSGPDERFAAYTRFLSPLRYLRYDRNPPAALQALLPRGRTIRNPFYYDSRSAADEAYETYGALLAELVADDIAVALLHSQQEIVRVARGVGSAMLLAVHTPRVHRYPYLAPGGHYSSFGNRLVAEQFFNLLVDGEATAQTLAFERAPKTATGADRSASSPSPISSYERIEVTLDGVEAGFLAAASADPGQRGGAATDLYQSDARSLLVMVAAGRPVVDAPIVVVRELIATGQELRLRASGDAVDGGSLLGTVEVLDERVPVGVVEVDGLDFDGALRMRVDAADDATALRVARGGLVIALAGTPILTAEPVASDLLLLEPVEEPLRGLRVGAGDYAEPTGLGAGGDVVVRFDTSEGARDVVLAKWRRGGPVPSFAPPKLRSLLRIDGGRAELVEPPR